MLLSFKSFLREERLLLENRLDFLKKKYKDLDFRWDTHDWDSCDPSTVRGMVIDFFAKNVDPTTNKKYLDWILRQYSKHNFRQEDGYRVKLTLLDFEHYKNHIQQKDINQYQSLSDLEDAIEAVAGTKSKREEIRDIKHEGADKIFDKGGVTVYRIKTEAAAKFYGAGTKWCTAAENHCQFNNYNSRGPLYVVFCKDLEGKQAKFQFHFEDDQFMDVRDEEVNLTKLLKKNPELKEVPAWQGKNILLTTDKNFSKYFNQFLTLNNSLSVLKDPRVTDEMIQNALNSPISEVRKRILIYPNITREQLAKALNDSHEDVRYNAIVHPNATEAHLKRASEDFIKRNKEKAKERLTREFHK